jgi:murein DD-endopeptidase MepM/ murein hydrolase activator NlpD
MRTLHGTRFPLAFILALLLLVAGSAGAEPSAPASGASARAYGIVVSVPGQAGAGIASVSAPGDAVTFAPGFSYGANGEVTSGAITASASASSTDATASATGSSEVTSLSLFGGEVTASRVMGRAHAEADSGQGAGDFEGATVEGLTVLGAGVAAGPGVRVPLGDWGYAVTLAQAGAPSDASYRGSVTALQIVLTAEHAGLPANTTISVGYAEATATAPKLEEPTTTATPTQTTTRPRANPRERPSSEAPVAGEGKTTVPPIVRKPPPHIQARLTKGGYVFPVHGPVSYTDTFRAPRAVVGWHHGEDIFAPIGAPILAVARGTLFSVGWNDIGGNRFWLRDTQGNEFYYAHLSAFTTLAVNGAQVNAGDVIGFVGNTGDAQTTPPHLHFEIHPVGMLALGYDGVINPNLVLDRWRRLEDIRLIPGSTLVPSVGGFSTAPAPGAYLLSSTDISSVSGLEPGSLRRALAEPVSAERSETAAPASAEAPAGLP